MAGMKLPPPEEQPQNTRTPANADIISDDDRSIAADSWSIKSEYGSIFDDDQRHDDATEALDAANLRPCSEYNSVEEEENGDGICSMLGLQSYWNAAYSHDLAVFRQHGHPGQIWFGPEVMDTVVSWTKSLCINISRRRMLSHSNGDKVEHIEHVHDLSSWSVLDLGTGNGLLLQELAKQGFSDLTGVDYSEGAIDLARGLADRHELKNINFLVDDVLDTKIDKQFQLVMDKGTLDAIGLHPDGPIKRLMYWDFVSKLVAPGGILVITSCNSTKDELMQEVENFNQRSASTGGLINQETLTSSPHFHYIDHVRSYPMFGGVVGSRVATVAFIRN